MVITMKKKKLYKVLDQLIYIVGYSLVLITVSIIFKKTIYIDNSMYGMWSFLASIIIFILNKTIKPLLVWLTLPLTAISLGLFYPLINVLILNIVDFILGSHFKIEGILMSALVAIIISTMNYILGELIIKPIIGGKYE